MTAFTAGAATDIGRIRQANEDAYYVGERLFAVADGMGGHRGGAVAAGVALTSLRERFEPTTTDRLVEAVEEANALVVERAEADPELAGMGTTLTALALVEDDDRHLLAVANVGDSRLYLMKEGELEQITEDHSLVATLERQGRITRDEAATHPQRNILTRALGIDGTVMVDSWEIVPFVGDRYLLCTDGLYNELDDHRIAAGLRRLADPTDAARELVRLAHDAGGRDNITCVVVDVVDDAGRDPAVSASDDRVASAAPSPDPPGVGAAVDRVGGEVSGRRGDTAVHEAIGPDGEPAGRPGADDGDARPRARSRFTWRVALFGLAFLAIVGAAVAAVVYVGTGTYYVGFDGEQVVIFQGRPGGVLWIEPELEEPTDLTRDDLTPSAAIDVDRGKQEASLDDARSYVENLRSQTTTTTTTTTTPPAAPPPAPAAEPEPAEPGLVP
jgi:PPM family protein phosphatase